MADSRAKARKIPDKPETSYYNREQGFYLSMGS